jgi:hypothetical protein
MGTRLKSIDSLAETIAKPYDVDPKRLRTALKTETEAGNDLCHHKSFVAEALEHLPTDEAMSLFKPSEWKRVVERAQIIRRLADVRTPLYSLPELKDYIRGFIIHLDRNKSSILDRGLPDTSFSQCPWLDAMLTNLYFTKLPQTVTATPDGESYKYTYWWPKEKLEPHRCMTWSRPTIAQDTSGDSDIVPNSFGHHWTYFRRAWGQISNEVRCTEEWDDGILLSGMTKELADLIVSARPKLFNAKKSILESIAHALDAEDLNFFRRACQHLFTVLVPFENRTIVMDIEKLYPQRFDDLKGGVGYRSRTIQEIDDYHGGITSMLRVVGHIEQELEIGTYRKAREAFDGYIAGGAIYCGSHFVQNSYFGFIAQGEQTRIDGALDNHLKALGDNEQFWNQYRDRAWTAMFIQRPAKRYVMHKADFSECLDVNFTTERMRAIFRVLYEHWENGNDDPLRQRDIMRSVEKLTGKPSPEGTRVRDCFPRSGEWEKLIQKTSDSTPKYRFSPPPEYVFTQ